MDLSLLRSYAISLIGTPYFYGSDDPIKGADCSGYASELMRASGIAPWNYRDNAQGIYNRLVHPFYGRVCQSQLGAFSFYGTSGMVNHVGFCLDGITMVEAGGGDATTTTLEQAAKQNAFVRMRPVLYRADFLRCSMPHYEMQGVPKR